MATKPDIDKISKAMDFITMADMKKKINIQRIIMEDYDGSERDLALFLVQGFFNHMLSTSGGDMNRHGLEKSLAYSKWFATKRLSSEKDGLNGLIERGKMYLLNDAENTGWHHILEYDDVAELLASILEDKEGMTEAYDWKFIVEQLVPAAEKAEISPDIVMGASLNVKKMRGIVPAARELLRKQENEEVELEEAEETLKGWLRKAVDPNVSYTGLREELDEWRGKANKAKEPIKGYRIMMPSGNWALFIETENDRDVSMIEQALKNRVDISITGFDYLQAKAVGKSTIQPLHFEMSKVLSDHEYEMLMEGRREMLEHGSNEH